MKLDIGAVDAIEAENIERFLTRAEEMKRRHQKDLHELNNRKDGARRARRSVPSGPAAIALVPLIFAAIVGVVLWVLLIALARWVGELIFRGGK
jgi:hypothetical protein